MHKTELRETKTGGRLFYPEISGESTLRSVGSLP